MRPVCNTSSELRQIQIGHSDQIGQRNFFRSQQLDRHGVGNGFFLIDLFLSVAPRDVSIVEIGTGDGRDAERPVGVDNAQPTLVLTSGLDDLDGLGQLTRRKRNDGFARLQAGIGIESETWKSTFVLTEKSSVPPRASTVYSSCATRMAFFCTCVMVTVSASPSSSLKKATRAER